MAYSRIWILMIIAGFFTFSTYASPANVAEIWAKVSGEVVGGLIRFIGWVNFSLFTRKGKVTGTLNSGASCRGSSWINIGISHGGGNLKCNNGLSAKFKFMLSSRFPVRGKGSGRLADGRKLLLKISPVG